MAEPGADSGRTIAGSSPAAAVGPAADVFAATQRATRRSGWLRIAFGVLAALLLTVPAAFDSRPWETVVRIGTAAGSGAVLVGLLMAVSALPLDERRAIRRASWLSLAPALLVLRYVTPGSNDSLAGAWYILAWAAYGAIAGGPLVGVGMRMLAAGSSRSEPNPVVSEPSPHRGLGLITAVLAVGGIAASTIAEHSAEAVVRTVQSALIDADDLPHGWEPCCGADLIVRGNGLDEHICGADSDDLPAHRAGVRRSFNKPTAGNPDFLDAHLDVSVLLSASPEHAQAEFGAVDSEGYQACTTRTVGVLARYWQARAIGEPRVEYVGRERVLGLSDALIDTYRVGVPVSEGIDVGWVHFVRMRSGPAIIRLPVHAMAMGPLDSSELTSIIWAVRNLVDATEWD